MFGKPSDARESQKGDTARLTEQYPELTVAEHLGIFETERNKLRDTKFHDVASLFTASGIEAVYRVDKKYPDPKGTGEITLFGKFRDEKGFEVIPLFILKRSDFRVTGIKETLELKDRLHDPALRKALAIILSQTLSPFAAFAGNRSRNG